MTDSTSPGRFIAAAAGAALADACSAQPEAVIETPVNPAPGRYEVTLAGGGVARFAKRQSNAATFCLRASDASSFPDMVARNYLEIHPGCTNTRAPREGNTFGGVVKCSVDPEKASGSMTYIYSGKIAVDSVMVNAEMKLDVTPNARTVTAAESAQLKLLRRGMQAVRLVITAKRVGACV